MFLSIVNVWVLRHIQASIQVSKTWATPKVSMCLCEHRRHCEFIHLSPLLLLMMSDTTKWCHCQLPESSPKASSHSVLPLMRRDIYLKWKHICFHYKQAISSGPPVRSSHSCQMPLVHIFAANSWQVKWTRNTLPSLESLRNASDWKFCQFKSVSLQEKLFVGIGNVRCSPVPQQQSATGQGS